MEATSRHDLVDRATGYRLNDILAAAPSYSAARDILRDEHDVVVPESTLRRWHLSVINDRDDAWPAEGVAS